MPLNSQPIKVWDINEVEFIGYSSFGYGNSSPIPAAHGGQMYVPWTDTGIFREAWTTREAAHAAAIKLNPLMDTYYTDQPDDSANSSTFYDGLSGLLNNGVDLAAKVAGIATAFRGGANSPTAQRTLADAQKAQTTASNTKTYWIIGGIGAAVLLVIAFVMMRKK